VRACRVVSYIYFSTIRIDHLEGSDVDGSKILRWIVRKWDGGAWTGLMGLRIGTGSGHL
jgi:hypothetical protein